MTDNVLAITAIVSFLIGMIFHVAWFTIGTVAFLRYSQKYRDRVSKVVDKFQALADNDERSK